MRNTQLRKFPGTSAFTDVRGKRRWRYRKGNLTVSLGTEYGSPEFVRKYEAALRGERLPGNSGKPGLATDSLCSHAERWLSSDGFRARANATQATYSGEVKRLTDRHGEVLAKSLDGERIHEMVAEKAATPSAANNMLRVLRLVLEHARETKRLKANPALSVSMLPVESNGFHIWTEQDIADFYSEHTEGTTADLAMTLMLYTSATRSEVVRFGKEHIYHHAGQPRLRFQKYHAGHFITTVDIPVHSQLWRRIKPLMDRTTFLQTQQGNPRKPTGLGNSMRVWCDKAGLPECSSHGLRKACRRRLAEAERSEQEIAAVCGYVDTNVPHGVVGMGDRPKMAAAAIGSLPV